MIRLIVPDIGDVELAAVTDVLRTGHLVQGARVAEFEAAIARVAGVQHAVAVSSGTSALHLALLALDIGHGDRVAVPTYSWPATANVVVLSGAEPVFVEIEGHTFGMDPKALEETLRCDASIRAVMPVHAFGSMADIGAILEVASARGVPVIEDAACALGATLDGRCAGSWGKVGCFSFHPRKIITTGEGGAVTTNDSALAERIRTLRNHGLKPGAGAPTFIEAGFNQRLTEFQAALGQAQLRRIDQIVARRRELADLYGVLLKGLPVTVPSPQSPTSHTYQSYVVLLPQGSNRSALMARLHAQGIETAIGTHHIPLTNFYAQRGGFAIGSFPITDDVASRALTLPLYSGLDEFSQKHVISRLAAELQ